MSDRPRHPGPPLAFPAVAFAVLFIAPGIFAGSAAIPSPFGSTATVHGYFAANQQVSQLTGFLMLLSAVFLALLTAVAVSRLKYLAPTAPGPAVAGVGGLIAATLLAMSALTQWAQGTPVVTSDPTLTHALHYFGFAVGGPGHVTAFGMLLFGIAITCWHLGRVPKWLCVVGFVIAGIAVLSSVSLIVQPAAVCIPVGRFLGMAWLIAIAALIPRERAARRNAAEARQ